MAKKILIIDDEPEILALIRTRLEANQLEVVEAGNGEEGLEKLKTEKPNMVIADISMPKMDGYTFALEVKKMEEFKNIPIIILTAKDKMEELFKMEGITDYIVKPFDGDKILEKISKYF